MTDQVGPLSRLDEPFVQTISLTDLIPFLRRSAWIGNSCPPQARVWLIHAFLARSVYPFPPTAALLDARRSRPTLRQLCGWESVFEPENTAARHGCTPNCARAMRCCRRKGNEARRARHFC